MNYKKEYSKLIKDIKYKLSKLYLDQKIKAKYEQRLLALIDMIDEDSDEFRYYEAFLKAAKLEASISKLIDSKKNYILPPSENASYLAENIKTERQQLKEYKEKLKSLKVDVVSYILTGAIFLSAGAYMLTNDSKKPNDNKLYLTESKTYCDNVDKVINTSEYQSARKDSVIIKKIMPWVRNEKEATREEYTYRINNMTYDEIVSSKDYEKAIANLEFESRTETMPIEKFGSVYRYYEPLYEVTEIKQNKDIYTLQKRFLHRDTMLALFGELMIYILVVNFNHNRLLCESILIEANDIKSTDKIIDAKRDTLTLLKKQYQVAKKKTLKK